MLLAVLCHPCLLFLLLAGRCSTPLTETVCCCLLLLAALCYPWLLFLLLAGRRSTPLAGTVCCCLLLLATLCYWMLSWMPVAVEAAQASLDACGWGTLKFPK